MRTAIEDTSWPAQGHYVCLNLGNERALLNTCIGLCFVTVKEATLDKMLVVYTQTDPFTFSKNVFLLPKRKSWRQLCSFIRDRVLIFDIFSDVY